MTSTTSGSLSWRIDPSLETYMGPRERVRELRQHAWGWIPVAVMFAKHLPVKPRGLSETRVFGWTISYRKRKATNEAKSERKNFDTLKGGIRTRDRPRTADATRRIKSLQDNGIINEASCTFERLEFPRQSRSTGRGRSRDVKTERSENVASRPKPARIMTIPCPNGVLHRHVMHVEPFAATGIFGISGIAKVYGGRHSCKYRTRRPRVQWLRTLNDNTDRETTVVVHSLDKEGQNTRTAQNDPFTPNKCSRLQRSCIALDQYCIAVVARALFRARWFDGSTGVRRCSYIRCQLPDRRLSSRVFSTRV
ncbi:hypothetical protein EVAR_61990_1 [Eumeta japonica]|uniref:Uncharacterized protein n=1 Tax=Eumeta variegata TaxID=151549 RepID=A0A4C1YGR4_EUMVA|nr:hypothetical protein EVAR_61990_1 [Eumeta japonica]